MANKKLKIAVIGAPSAGKTALVLDVVSELKKQSILAQFVGEAIRIWRNEHGRNTEVPQDQFPVLLKQMKKEKEALLTQDVMITDNSTWLGAVYSSILVRQGTDREYSDLIHVVHLIQETLLADYDLQYLCPRVFKAHLEKGRIQTKEEEFDLIDRKIRGMIDLFNIPVVELPKDHKQWKNIIVEDILRKLDE